VEFDHTESKRIILTLSVGDGLLGFPRGAGICFGYYPFFGLYVLTDASCRNRFSSQDKKRAKIEICCAGSLGILALQ
jgi:hypothetical protein